MRPSFPTRSAVTWSGADSGRRIRLRRPTAALASPAAYGSTMNVLARSPAVAAVAYARRGWSVVPVHTAVHGRCSCGRRDCPSPGKHPRVRWSPRTREAATPEEVAEWWRRWPDANVGVVTGAVSALVVIDVDPRNDGDLALDELEAGWGSLPETVTSVTGGGGEHLWYATEEEVPSGVLGDGVELKGEGGLVVAPPSRHVSGGTYRWEHGRSPDDRDLAPLPAWVVDVVRGGFRAGRPREDAPVRTAAEREAFAEAWARAGVTLRPGDHHYLCPFHDDHRPSLHVDAERCRWYCFACRKGGGVGALLRELGEERPVRPRRRLRGFVGPRRRVTMPGDVGVEVVGESRHQDTLLQLTGGRRSYAGVEMDAVADLIPDPTDPLDVEVLIGDRRVGWLRRADAEALAEEIAAARERFGAATCLARIRGGWDRGGDDVGLFGVVLHCHRP